MSTVSNSCDKCKACDKCTCCCKDVANTNQGEGIRTTDIIIISALIAIGLSIGMWGYGRFARLNLVDSFYNATMILTTLGPTGIKNLPDSGKIFASIYALISGFIFIFVISYLAARLLDSPVNS